MSGGHFEYANDRACHEVFNWDVNADYGLGTNPYYDESVKMARKLNPMEDSMLSELVFDVFCLLHSADWYKSGDNCEETYRKDVDFFKAKWLGKPTSKIVDEEIEKALNALRGELEKTLLWSKEAEGR
jgi:hypothetical protein